jgi:hypothetical protein
MSGRGRLKIGLVLLGALGVICPVLSQNPAIPEPDVIFYGTYAPRGATSPVAPTSLSWVISGNGESVEVSAFTVVTVGGDSFYLSRIPFETREVAGANRRDATTGRLELTATATTYSRVPIVDGKTAPLPEPKRTFSYGGAVQGLVERLDLSEGPPPETFSEWSNRIFGRLVLPGDDEDNDGYTNDDEYQTGTNPIDPSSGLAPLSFTPLPEGGFSLGFRTSEGVRYQLEKALSPADAGVWTAIGGIRIGTGAVEQFAVPPDEVGDRMFYRLRILGR